MTATQQHIQEQISSLNWLQNPAKTYDEISYFEYSALKKGFCYDRLHGYALRRRM